jgi:hypothetical protein
MLLNSMFFCEFYVKCCYARKCWRKFRQKFPRIIVPRATGTTGGEKLNELRAKNTPQKSLICLAQKISISKFSPTKAVN